MQTYYSNLAKIIATQVLSGEDSSSYRRQLYYIFIDSFVNKMNSDELKIQFWTNIYDAYLNLMLGENVDEAEIFTKKRIKFAYNFLSLNDIEYGILRKKKTFKFVQVRMPIFNSFIGQLALENADSASNVMLIKDISSPSLNQKINHRKTLNFSNIG